jgi:hypothetical protein
MAADQDAKTHDDKSSGHHEPIVGAKWARSRICWTVAIRGRLSKVGHLHCSGFRKISGSFATLAAIRRAGDAAQMRQLNYLGCCKFVTMQTALRSVVASSRDVEAGIQPKIIHRVQIDRLGFEC